MNRECCTSDLNSHNSAAAIGALPPIQRLSPSATGALSGESDLREEGCDVTRKALRFLCGSEVPTARH